MRILYLSQLIPYPADAGPKVRIYHVLQYLAAAGHQVTLVAFRRQNDQQEAIDHLRRFCHAIHTVLLRRSRGRDAWHLAHSLLGGRPFLIGRDEMSEMHRLLAALLQQQPFDAVHADQLWMAQYALAAKTNSGMNGELQLTLDQHNAVYLIPQRMAAGTANPLKRAILSLESHRLARYEVEVCREFDRVVWVTAEDEAAVFQAATSGLVIPICVDPAVRPVVQRHPQPWRVTFLGGLHWPPNAEGVAWFMREVWPVIHQQVPQARLTVIGKEPPRKLGELSKSLSAVEICGYVTDPLPYLAETAVFIVPLHAGGGMRVKIIDAWSWGLPVVSTTIGAEGIAYEHEANLLIADSANAFTQAVVRLLHNTAVANRIAAAGRQSVETQYNWRHTYSAWDEVYQRDPS